MKILSEGIQFVKGVGPQRSKILQRLEILTVFDLLWYVPRTYFNRNNVQKIATLSDGGEIVSIRGRIIAAKLNRTRRGFHIFKAMIEDDSGTISAVWFNQPYLARQLKSGQDLFISGRVKGAYGSQELHVTDFDIFDGADNYPVLPIYALTEGINQRTMRKIMLNALNSFLPAYPDILDADLQARYGLTGIQFAFRNVHFPSSGAAYLTARKRLAFEELLLFKLNLAMERAPEKHDKSAIVHRPKNDLVDSIIQDIPFKLTAAQMRVSREIIHDMESTTSMNRLLQGDVGSGKTLVAALAMAHAVASGYQAAIMVPTEILANQHFLSFKKIFQNTETVIACLTGGTTGGERRTILEAAATGELDILIGTHALIQGEVQFKNLGLAVIDEQHRFGVRQRAQLGNKGGVPDVLVMTATPIPRTLALALYGDLNVSVLDELPPGRQTVKTAYIPRSSRHKAYQFIRTAIQNGAQVYVVCPLVEESENQDLQAAVTLYEELKTLVYPDLKLGLLHGRMKPAEKDCVMKLFQKGEIDVLVTTTVVEVGVDVSNASIMLIEHAERFGLSQLHQLRGRVGRGNQQSYCILIGEPKTEEGKQRLSAMEKTSDGFVLANEDLRIRGPGDFWGIKQHGLNELKVANLLRDQKMIAAASVAALDFKPQQIKAEELERYIIMKFKKNAFIVLN